MGRGNHDRSGWNRACKTLKSKESKQHEDFFCNRSVTVVIRLYLGSCDCILGHPAATAASSGNCSTCPRTLSCSGSQASSCSGSQASPCASAETSCAGSETSCAGSETPCSGSQAEQCSSSKAEQCSGSQTEQCPGKTKNGSSVRAAKQSELQT